MKIVTYNARYDCIADEINCFEYRKPFVLEKINQEKPDVIGFQEVLPEMLTWFKESLVDYTVLGCARDADLTGETAAVAFRKTCFNLMQMETFWLSPTPLVPGTRYKEQSVCPRICTVLLLHDLRTGLVFRVYNTHLDHEGEEARVLGMRQILKKIKSQEFFPDAPILLMGDFNAEPYEREIKMCEEEGLVELTKDVEVTFHNYGRRVPYIKIDYIYGSSNFVCRRYTLWDDKKGDMYLSDHYPVCVEVEVGDGC